MPELSELKEIIRKYRKLKEQSSEIFSIEQFDWFFEVFILWCIIKTEDEIESLINKMQAEVTAYLEGFDAGCCVQRSPSRKIH